MTANGCIRLQNTTTGGNRCCGQGAGPAVMGWGSTTDTLLPVWGMVIKPQATGIGEAENKSGKWKVDDDFMDKGKGKKGVGFNSGDFGRGDNEHGCKTGNYGGKGSTAHPQGGAISLTTGLPGLLPPTIGEEKMQVMGQNKGVLRQQNTHIRQALQLA